MIAREPWAEINAQPLKSPPAWVVPPIASGELNRQAPLDGRIRRLQGEPSCGTCGNRTAWRCQCDAEEEQ